MARLAVGLAWMAGLAWLGLAELSWLAWLSYAGLAAASETERQYLRPWAGLATDGAAWDDWANDNATDKINTSSVDFCLQLALKRFY